MAFAARIKVPQVGAAAAKILAKAYGSVTSQEASVESLIEVEGFGEKETAEGIAAFSTAAKLMPLSSIICSNMSMNPQRKFLKEMTRFSTVRHLLLQAPP